MSNFPLVRYKATDTWIPETDIDGVDAVESVVADVSNTDFSNGFFENASNVTALDTPTGVLAKQILGYVLLSSKTFYHSTQGQQTVYILWKESTSDLVIYRNNTLMVIDENNLGITYLSKPEIVSYNLVNDQLKINLNIQATFIIPEPVILNLTLVYLNETKYDATNERAEGWYLCPRWLGWAQKNLAYLYNPYPKGEITEDFEDNIYINNFSLASVIGYGSSIWTRRDYWNTADGEGCLIAENGSLTSYQSFSCKITGLRNLKEIKVSYRSRGFGQLSPTGHINYGSVKFIVRETGDVHSDVVVGTIDEGMMDDGQSGDVTLDVSKVTNTTFELIIVASVPPRYDSLAGTTIVGITQLVLTPAKVDVLALYSDGQRALLFEDGLGVYGETNNLKFSINENIIDWRITKYEIYADISQGYSVLVSEVAVDGTGWTKASSTLSKNVTFIEPEEWVALSFKYNLANDSYVDNQRHIYSEIAHKGRVYFVNNDYKVYQSHISTNLAIQADAFPYDEETGFGYFVVDHSKLNLALATSPTNDMVIITNQGLYVYFIQPSGSGSFKQLRIGSGNITISSNKTLTSLLNGEPATDGLFWIDNNGIYYYGGGLTPPENLITLTHQRYWESLSVQDKEEAVGFYNPIRKEYWLYINQEFVIFELSYKKFKKYNGISGAVEFVGHIDLIPVYMDGAALFSCAPAERLSALIETHYNSIEANPEIYHKILQELYLEFGTSDIGVIVTMLVYADDWLVGTYIFNSSKRFDKWLSPAGVRFNRLKLKIIVPVNEYVRIKEFGFSYSPDISEPLAITPINIAESGYGFDYGNNY